MSGKAIIVLVTGVIIITATIMFNIEAASTRIVKNFSDYYMRQTTQNIAQSGVNLAITQIGKDRNWRDGFSNLALLDGKVDVKVWQTFWDSIPAIAIQSIAATDYGHNQWRRDTSMAWLFWTPKQYPISIKGLLTLNSDVSVNGNITLDGRNHDLKGNLIASSGIPAIWTTQDDFTLGSSAAKLGGTKDFIDHAPANPPAMAVVAKKETYPGGFPQTPDSVFGGESNGFPEGTLKAIAMSGYAGSQYVTDPGKLKYPLSGVTYVEMPTSTPQNEWSSASIPGEGILVVHNSAGNASLKNATAAFTGLIISDDVVHLHGNILGGVIAFTSALGGNVVGNGSGNILYSNEALVEAAKFLENAGRPNVIAWWE